MLVYLEGGELLPAVHKAALLTSWPCLFRESHRSQLFAETQEVIHLAWPIVAMIIQAVTHD